MLGQITEWFYGDLAGLAPMAEFPGFARVRVRPQPVPGVTWVRAAHDSPRGRVAVSWRREGTAFILEVELPPNVSGEVWVPASDTGDVQEGGRPAREVPGVRFVGQDGGRFKFEVGSGRYSFSSTLPSSP